MLGCDGVSNNPKKLFCKLPSDDEERRKWLSTLNRPDLNDLSFSELEDIKVCGAHFTSSQYNTPTSRFLNYSVIPMESGKNFF